MPSIFSSVELAPRDPILGLTETFNADSRPGKVNLGVGVYYSEPGRIPLLDCVSAAERDLLRAASARGYMPIEGPSAYALQVQRLLFGADSETIASGRCAGRHRCAPYRCRPDQAVEAGRDRDDQRAELGKSPRPVRGSRLPGPQ